jgi:SGNH domain-containing protein
VLFFGDSHMQQFLPRIEALMLNKTSERRTVIFRTRGGCAPFPGIDRPGYDCDRFVADAFAVAHRSAVHTVVISASWVGFTDRKDYYKAGDFLGQPLTLMSPQTQWILDGFEAEITSLVRAGKQVVIVLSSPVGEEFDPRRMVRRDGMNFTVVLPRAVVPRSAISSETAFIDERIRQIAVHAKATILDPLDTLCPSAECPILDSEGKPVLRDYSHLRSSFVRLHFDAFDQYVLIDSHATPSAAARR